MRQFVVSRSSKAHNVKRVEVFGENEHLEAAACREVAQEIEGLEATIFIGADLSDVVRSHEGFFSEPLPASPSPIRSRE